MNNTKRKKLSGRVTFFLFTLIPVVLYTFFYVVSVINGIRTVLQTGMEWLRK